MHFIKRSSDCHYECRQAFHFTNLPSRAVYWAAFRRHGKRLRVCRIGAIALGLGWSIGCASGGGMGCKPILKPFIEVS
jgi:hypothetical protein